MSNNENHVIIYLTRHAQSCANYHFLFPNKNINPIDHIDTPLSPEGIEQVILNRDNLVDINCDVIFCSPLKRCIQTCLQTYNKKDIVKNIYLTSILTECDDNYECQGRTIDEINKDIDLVYYKHFHQINYKYFWFGNPNSNNWSEPSFRIDVSRRVKSFFKLMSSPEFTGKKIHVFTHAGFIFNSIGNNVSNYSTVKLIYNQINNMATIEYL